MLAGPAPERALTPLPPAAAVSTLGPGELPPVDAVYATAAVAMRSGDFAAALQTLERESERDDERGRHARMVAGLFAHSRERPELAVRLLAEEPATLGPLEDWRLWVLADSRAASGDPGGALAACERLLADWPASPLAGRAAVRAVELAREAGRPERALALVAVARAAPLPAELAERRERAAWELGHALGHADLQRSAAERLLSEMPLAAAELGVAARFPVGQLPRELLLRRAEALLRAGLAADAQNVLLVVPAAERDLDWDLLLARVLTLSRRGDAALLHLASLAPAGDEQRARVAWARATAELERAQARAGGKTAAAVRARHRERALAHLDEAARLGGRELARDALRRLFTEQAALERIDDVLRTLGRLRALDPTDTTGSRFLWERGWREYRDRNYTGAIGYWSELAALAPADRFARGARYWSARAFATLGDEARARDLYRELVAVDTNDFYRRHAAARLGPHAATVAVAAPPAEPWPADPQLRRARYLTDIGLDGLAAAELELLGEAADTRARQALTGLLLARQGRPRASMDHLRAAFPNLGTPLQATVPAAALELYYPLLYREPVERWANARELPVPLVLGVIRQESAFDVVATSRSGARGLMQLMPRTAQEVAGKLGIGFSRESLADPDYNLRLGTAYLAEVLQMFDGNVELALAGYNSGPYRLRRLWREAPRQEVDSFIEGLPLEEPRIYVKRILLLSDSYSRLYPELEG